MVAFYADYDAQCNREGVVDFAELLLRTFELLAKNLNLLQHYQNRFRYILVDEFQDTNKLQYKWIKMLAGSNGCVFAVGDDDQCLPAGTLVTMADGIAQADRVGARGRPRALLLRATAASAPATVVDDALEPRAPRPGRDHDPQRPHPRQHARALRTSRYAARRGARRLACAHTGRCGMRSGAR